MDIPAEILKGISGYFSRSLRLWGLVFLMGLTLRKLSLFFPWQNSTCTRLWLPVIITLWSDFGSQVNWGGGGKQGKERSLSELAGWEVVKAGSEVTGSVYMRVEIISFTRISLGKTLIYVSRFFLEWDRRTSSLNIRIKHNKNWSQNCI